MKTYAIDLCNYDENNIPEPEITVLVKSECDLESIPRHVLEKNETIQELMKECECEGIGFIYEIPEKEVEEDYETKISELIEI